MSSVAYFGLPMPSLTNGLCRSSSATPKPTVRGRHWRQLYATANKNEPNNFRTQWLEWPWEVSHAWENHRTKWGQPWFFAGLLLGQRFGGRPQHGEGIVKSDLWAFYPRVWRASRVSTFSALSSTLFLIKPVACKTDLTRVKPYTSLYIHHICGMDTNLPTTLMLTGVPGFWPIAISS